MHAVYIHAYCPQPLSVVVRSTVVSAPALCVMYAVCACACMCRRCVRAPASHREGHVHTCCLDVGFISLFLLRNIRFFLAACYGRPRGPDAPTPELAGGRKLGFSTHSQKKSCAAKINLIRQLLVPVRRLLGGHTTRGLVWPGGATASQPAIHTAQAQAHRQVKVESHAARTRVAERQGSGRRPTRYSRHTFAAQDAALGAGRACQLSGNILD